MKLAPHPLLSAQLDKLPTPVSQIKLVEKCLWSRRGEADAGRTMLGVAPPPPPPCMQTHRGMPRCTDSQAHLLCCIETHPFICLGISSAPTICQLQDCLACDNNLSQPLRKLQFSKDRPEQASLL